MSNKKIMAYWNYNKQYAPSQYRFGLHLNIEAANLIKLYH
jgi:hypothetical protein